MLNEKLYNKTVSILVDAYFKNTLESQDCTACAVGNIIAANNNYEIVKVSGESYWMDKEGNYIDPLWLNVVGTTEKRILGIKLFTKQFLKMDKYDEDVKREIESSGYKLHEFALIENAFEKGYKGKDKMFNGLMSVIDCLDEIHKNKNVSITQNSKALFKLQGVSNK
jgi:hypothetical protein